jgi:hypothetical protein
LIDNQHNSIYNLLENKLINAPFINKNINNIYTHQTESEAGLFELIFLARWIAKDESRLPQVCESFNEKLKLREDLPFRAWEEFPARSIDFPRTAPESIL